MTDLGPALRRRRHEIAERWKARLGERALEETETAVALERLLPRLVDRLGEDLVAGRAERFPALLETAEDVLDAHPGAVVRALRLLVPAAVDVFGAEDSGVELSPEDRLRLDGLLMEGLELWLDGTGSRGGASRQLLREALDDAPVGIVLMDLEGRHLFANREWSRQTGIPQGDVRGKTSYEIWGNEEARAAGEAQLEAIRSGAGIPLTQYAHEQDGRVVHYRWALAPLHDPFGDLAGGVAFTLDVTDEVAAREAAERLREHLLAGVAHDLRGPLSAAKLHAQALERRLASPDPRLGRIQLAVDRAARLVTDMLTASRVRSSAELPLRRGPTNLAQVVRSVHTDLPEEERERVRLQGAEVASPGVWDAEALARVIWNLVSNALRHGDREAPIQVRLGGDEADARIEVVNAGPPIPASAQASVFEPWKRPEEKSRGWGLGLFVVRALVEAHGGRVELSSDAEHGTCFAVRLPRRPPL